MIKKSMAVLLSIAIITPLLIYLLCPPPELKNYIPYSKAFYDVDGKLLRLSLAKDQRYRLYKPLQDISPKLINATILYEDQNYYSHGGVDALALLRAFWTTYILRERRVGASTLAMQLARLRWQINSTSLPGKMYQIVRAIQLSRHYSKHEILEAYLNLTPYGHNIEGIGAASAIYFDKQPSQLSLPEALTLAVIPQNPNKRTPTHKQGYNNLLAARSLLFQRWLERCPEDRKKAKFFDLELVIRSLDQLPFEAPHFITFVDAQLSEWEGGNVKTTIKLHSQKRLEKIVANYVASNKRIGIANAAALLINHQSMSIEAMVGSSDFFDPKISGQVNGLTAKRSPGSALKPFVYALAMDQGLIHPLSLLKDLPTKFGGFTPENYDKQFLGPLSVKDALIESRNVPAVNLQANLTSRSFHQFLTEAGVSDLKDENHYGLALALGGGEVTGLELASLYSMLANGGMLNPINYLVDSHSSASNRLLSKEASFMILDILKNNPSPDELSFDIPGAKTNDIPWKTGTSWAFRDAWAVGLSGPYVLIVWIGNFDGSGDDSFVGRTAAGPLFFKIMDAIYPPQDWQVADLLYADNLNLKRVEVCSNTGDLFEKHCPATEESWFIPGVSPIKSSNIYRKVPINPVTGLRTCFHQPGVTELSLYEFWPSEFLQVFAMAGISLKSPPEYHQRCSLDITSTTGINPVITSPQSSIDYVYRFGSNQPLTIPLTANADASAQKLHWFIDSSYIASSTPTGVVTWNATPGEYEIRVVDGHGRSEVTQFRVISSAN